MWHVLGRRKMHGEFWREALKAPLGRRRYVCEGNIKIDMNCVNVSQDREKWQAVVYTVMKLGVP